MPLQSSGLPSTTMGLAARRARTSSLLAARLTGSSCRHSVPEALSSTVRCAFSAPTVTFSCESSMIHASPSRRTSARAHGTMASRRKNDSRFFIAHSSERGIQRSVSCYKLSRDRPRSPADRASSHRPSHHSAQLLQRDRSSDPFCSFVCRLPAHLLTRSCHWPRCQRRGSLIRCVHA